MPEPAGQPDGAAGPARPGPADRVASAGPDRAAAGPPGLPRTGGPGARGATVAEGLRLAVTTLTVLPLRAGRVDRSTAAVAMSLAPAVGAGLGVALTALLLALTAAGLPAAVAAAATVAGAVLLTRGLHLDGLADTVDALGSYRAGAAALEIMKKPDIGPFGVAAVALTLLVQAGAVAAVATRPATAVLAAMATATAAGRLAVPLCCRRGVPAARPTGLGALVAGTVPRWALAGAVAAVAVAALWAVPGRPWQGPLAVAGALGSAALLTRHAVRRFGGVTGDVIGAAVELSTTVAYLVLAATGQPAVT